ncbi:extracellular solute-binding protein [Marinospirillum perlucidum]|uniref:extracellular solute-binding protein n=1 Tax=Marinospirillum perlucidum TaxID=1982602 RepID=UPI000DF2BCA4|nr:extracellular solute-binding protein [Marinospirillum perlucidum]
MIRVVLALVLGWGLSIAQASTPYDRLLEQVRQLQASGRLPQEARLHLQVKEGNQAYFLGADQALKERWEMATGILLDIRLMPQQTAGEALQRDGQVDLLVARNQEYPDLFSRGLILSLNDFYAELGFYPEDEDWFLGEAQTVFHDQRLAVPGDADLLLLYLRQDLLDDPEEKSAFQARFGYPLKAPQTWQEYQDQVSFFHRPEQGLWGSVELRDPHLAWPFWLARFMAFSWPDTRLFDDQGRPRINTPAGQAALSSYLATLDMTPDSVRLAGSGYDAALPYFYKGQAYALMITPAASKLFRNRPLPISDRFSVHPLPGVYHNQSLVRSSVLAFGNNLVIPAQSRYPLLALLYALWITSADVSEEGLVLTRSFADPFRESHLQAPELAAVYGQATLDAIATSLPNTVNPALDQEGSGLYIEAFNQLLAEAIEQHLSEEVTLQRIEAAWQQISREQEILPDRAQDQQARRVAQ